MSYQDGGESLAQPYGLNQLLHFQPGQGIERAEWFVVFQRTECLRLPIARCTDAEVSQDTLPGKKARVLEHHSNLM